MFPNPHERAPLSKLHIIDELSPLRRRAKISARKLPQDFFLMRPDRLQGSCKLPSRPDVHTQGFSRKISQRERVSETRESSLQRGQLSSRNPNEQANTMNLIMGIISSSRQMKKAIRKHSLEMRKENSGSQLDQFRLELPPLLLRKGVTALC